MNLFLPHPDPVLSAQALADQHVVKMTLETAQFLCGALYVVDIRAKANELEALYKPGWLHHPTTRWAASSRAAYRFALDCGLALAAEYAHRFDKQHRSERIFGLVAAFLGQIPDLPMPPFILVAPERYTSSDVHASYRAYIADKYEQWRDTKRPAKWTRRTAPDWTSPRLPVEKIS
jgi:hypothetical protein